ncbi:ribosomal RNA small subunit methyltransferase A [Candidatus Dependentiae bacterium]|nr:ribosomal RNA small subunit methyltransferase A [Candidatus Dependentiae bacterium]
MSYRKPIRQGIELKKKHGQNFLKDHIYIDHMIEAVRVDKKISIMEIGCGEGILTQAILQGPCKQLKVFEIDPEWASFVEKTYGVDSRLTMIQQNVLDANWDLLIDQGPWVLLANLPYHVTFPILYKVYKYREMFQEGVIMVQEEVAQKIVKSGGRDFGYTSLFFQHYFTWKLLDKVPPEAFFPSPKVFSRLIYFIPQKNVIPILEEEEFWKFIKLCFHQPRRTLFNNLKQSHFNLAKLEEDLLLKRAQQLTMQDFLKIWSILYI